MVWGDSERFLQERENGPGFVAKQATINAAIFSFFITYYNDIFNGKLKKLEKVFKKGNS